MTGSAERAAGAAAHAPNKCAHCGLPVAPARAAAAAAPLYCCLGCALAARITGAAGEESQARWILARLMLAGFLAMNVMILSLLLYSVTVYDVEVTSRMQAVFYAACRWAMLVCSVGVLALLGIPVARYAAGELRRGRLTADLLILVGVGAAWGMSVHHTVAGTGDVYYDTATMLLVLLTLGRLLEARARAAATAAVTDLLGEVPDTACRLTADGEERVPTAQLRGGDRVVLRPGEAACVDGVIESGTADVDEAGLTGEARPAPKGPGDPLYAGTVNLNGRLVVRAVAVGADRTLARLTRLLDEARAERAPIQRLADRAAAWLLPFTGAVAAGALAWWWWHAGPAAGVLNALAVLVVACPCALGIATPIAMWIALDECARRGIVIRSVGALETLGRVDAALFDKTGTLTRPERTVVAIHAFGDTTEDEVLTAAAAVAAAGNHPAAHALTRAARERGTPLPGCAAFTQEPGRGMRARVGFANADVIVGSRAYVEMCGVAGLEPSASGADDADVWVAVDGVLCGAIALAEQLRPDAAAALESLRLRHISVELLTGDRAAHAERLAAAVQAPVRAELLPEDKLARVRALRHAGRCVAMVGDGINDAAALGAADVGVAMGCGADLTREAAGICLLHDDLADVAWLVRYARRVRRIVRANLLWACAYNAVALAAAAAGLLNPVIAALAMLGSSAAVLVNSLRLRTGAPPAAVEAASPPAPAPTRPALTGSASA